MTFVYMMLNQWRVIRDSFKDLISRKKNYVGTKDAHSIMMSKYKEVPDWWFLIVLLVTLESSKRLVVTAGSKSTTLLAPSLPALDDNRTAEV